MHQAGVLEDAGELAAGGGGAVGVLAAADRGPEREHALRVAELLGELLRQFGVGDLGSGLHLGDVGRGGFGQADRAGQLPDGPAAG